MASLSGKIKYFRTLVPHFHTSTHRTYRYGMITKRAFLFSAILSFVVASSSTEINIATSVSATHWSPCYYLTEQPSLHDGASTLATSGTQAIKLVIDKGLDGVYPWLTNVRLLALSVLRATLFTEEWGPPLPTYMHSRVSSHA